MDKNHVAQGKLFIKAPLSLQSPVIIGSGESVNSDVDVLRVVSNDDPPKSKPLIPATSLLGVFRSYLEKGLRKCFPVDPLLHGNFIYLFGDRDTEIAQSSLQCADIIIEDAEIKSRDGVAIDHATNTAIAHKKFSYEVMEYGEYFDLNLEITFREIFDPAVFKRLLLTIFNGIQSGHIRLGAKTNKGFGRLTVGADKIHMAELSFANKNHVWQWLSGNYRWNKFLDPKITPYDIRRKQFKIDAWFSIRNSLLIKAYSGKPEDPDAVPIKQAGKAVMPGTSVMGAVRHRAKKILKTLGVASVDEKMRDLFGFVDDEHRESEARKGRVLSEETLINNVIAEVQTRIKIDRFTGGTIHGALFEMMPLWQQNHGDAVHLMITLNDYHDWEAALFLFILKDLWAGDLPIGGEKNVGRGVLQGLRAEIIWDGKSVRLQADATGKLAYDAAAFAPLEAIANKLQEVIRQ